MTPESKDFHVYSDGTDTIFGTSAQEALEKYCKEIGAGEPDEFTPAEAFLLVPDDRKITIRSDDEGWVDGQKTLTAKEWVMFNLKYRPGSRMIGSTEF